MVIISFGVVDEVRWQSSRLPIGPTTNYNHVTQDHNSLGYVLACLSGDQT